MLSESFEKIYVINMSRRKDRWEQFQQKLPKDWPFKKPARYDALDGGVVAPPAWWDGGNGAWGCYKTHLRVLEDCLNNHINSVLILEDDAVCIEGFREKVELFWNHLPDDWEMIYLGGQHIQEDLRLPRKINDWVYHPFNVNRCHCYGFRGRRMIERAYKHLNDFAAWKVAHHVDHYLGELHKIIDCGLYVPREWLVAQSEGQSDICGEKLALRLFPSSDETVYPEIHLSCVALIGTYFSGINTIAGVLHRLGISLGNEIGPLEDSDKPSYFEDSYLGEICRNSYTEPWLEENLPYVDRVNQLRRWAGVQCRNTPKHTKILCGKHPILTLMGPELMEAWNQPKIIYMERPDEQCYEAMKQVSWCWHPQAAKYAFQLLRNAMEQFLNKYEPQLLRIHYSDIKHDSENIVNQICKFLDHVPETEDFQKTVTFLERNQNDLCFKL